MVVRGWVGVEKVYNFRIRVQIFIRFYAYDDFHIVVFINL